MKKLALLLLTPLLLTACVFPYTAVEYNNRVVEAVNASSESLDASYTQYYESLPSLPDKVTEETEVDIEVMEELHKTAQRNLKGVESLEELNAKNEEQKAATQTAIETYLAAANQYLTSYQEMLSYYGEGTYKEDLSQVSPLDEALYEEYNVLIEANNDLDDVLKEYVD